MKMEEKQEEKPESGEKTMRTFLLEIIDVKDAVAPNADISPVSRRSDEVPLPAIDKDFRAVVSRAVARLRQKSLGDHERHSQIGPQELLITTPV